MDVYDVTLGLFALQFHDWSTLLQEIKKASWQRPHN